MDDTMVPLDLFGSLIPEEILYEWEGPAIFTTVLSSGELALAYLLREHEAALLYRLCRTSPLLIGKLKLGEMSIREALLQDSTAWLVKTDLALRPIEAFCISSERFSEDLPSPLTLLWAHLE